MASIQQSLNQMFGSLAGLATAGSYMYRQSDAFKAKQFDKEAEGWQDLMDAEGATFLEQDEQFYAQQTKEAEGRMLAREKAYRLDPTTERADEYKFALKEYGDRLQEQKDNLKEQAENNAVSRLETRSMTAREMLASLAERKDLLSAKERGQLTTMMGRHKEKGGIDK